MKTSLLTSITDVIAYTYNGDIYCADCQPKGDNNPNNDQPQPVFAEQSGDLAEQCATCYTHIGDCDYYCAECGTATDGIYAVNCIGIYCHKCAELPISEDAATLGVDVEWRTAPAGGIVITARPADPDIEWPYLADILTLGGPADIYTIRRAIERGTGRDIN
jgi:hypothetical protein